MTREMLLLTVGAALSLSGCSGLGGDGSLRRIVSPDGRVEVAIDQGGASGLEFRMLHDGAEVVNPSQIGLTMARDDPDATVSPMRGMTILSVAKSRGEDRYRSVVSGGEGNSTGLGPEIVRPFAAMLVHAQEAQGARRKLDVEFRAYNAGAAFRLVVPGQAGMPTVKIGSETTAFRLPADYACLAVHQSKLSNSHEGEYAPVTVRNLRADGYYDLPLVCQTGRKRETLAITESGIENYAAAYLVTGHGNAQQSGVAIKLTPRPGEPSIAVRATLGAEGVKSPWRVMMVADRPETLVAATLVNDLAPSSRVADTSWIVPGKAAWGWWSGLLTRGVAEPGHNQATYEYYIDFAGRFGLPFYMIDRGWAWRGQPGEPENPIADITRTTHGVNMPELIRFARKRGVRIWLWVNWKALDRQMDTTLALYQRLGIAGIKVDYLDRQDQEMVAFYHRLLATAAKYRLMVNIHAAFVPRGLERTYPNYMTQEGVMGSEYNRWSRRDTARRHVELAYTRSTIGPMDYAPGGFRNVSPERFTPRNDAPLMMTTRAHQLALFVAFPSPLTILADSPVAYEDTQHKPVAGADFLKRVPTTWDETRGIAGEFGRSIAVAKRRGKTWFVGVLNDDQARSLSLPLDFLGEGRWRVASWTDGAAPDQVVTRAGEIAGGRGSLVVPLSAHGGAALMLEPVRRPAG